MQLSTSKLHMITYPRGGFRKCVQNNDLNPAAINLLNSFIPGVQTSCGDGLRGLKACNGILGQYSKNQCGFFQCTYLCMIIQSFFALAVDKIPGAHLLAQTRCWSLACRIRVGRFLLLVQLVLRLLAHYWAPWIMITYSTWLCAGFLFINRRAVESISCCSWVQPGTAALWPLLRKWPNGCLPIPPTETLRVF